MQSFKFYLLAVSVSFLGVGCGCGRGDLPPLGSVYGTVTLDGTPLSGVLIMVKPEQGRAATATTDQEGRYTLDYTYGVSGAKVGPATVMFEWPLGESGKPIPAKYTGLDSELKINVEDGDNELDFQLSSL